MSGTSSGMVASCCGRAAATPSGSTLPLAARARCPAIARSTRTSRPRSAATSKYPHQSKPSVGRAGCNVLRVACPQWHLPCSLREGSEARPNYTLHRVPPVAAPPVSPVSSAVGLRSRSHERPLWFLASPAAEPGDLAKAAVPVIRNGRSLSPDTSCERRRAAVVARIAARRGWHAAHVTAHWPDQTELAHGRQR